MDITNIYKVALLGQANSGKNTTADLLGRGFFKFYPLIDTTFAVMAFANPIKEMVMTMYPWADRNALYGASSLRKNIIPNAIDENGNPLTYRQLLIDLGEKGRKGNPNHWIDVYDHRVAQLPEEHKWETRKWKDKAIICSDVRYINECEYLKDKNYFLIKILRDLPSDNQLINHSSEQEQKTIKDEMFDYILDNNGSLNDLKQEITKIIAKIKSRRGARKS